jgi:hypothetical protein
MKEKIEEYPMELRIDKPNIKKEIKELIVALCQMR